MNRFGLGSRTLDSDPTYTNVMNAFASSFEAPLKPTLHPAAVQGGYGQTGRLQFTPSEDLLLALGL